MSNNCKNVELNGVVNDNSLDIFNSIHIDIEQIATGSFSSSVRVEVWLSDTEGNVIQAPIIKAPTGKYFTVGGVQYNSYTMQISEGVYSATIEFDNDNYTVFIYNCKYAMRQFVLLDTNNTKKHIAHFDISQLNYCYLRTLQATNYLGVNFNGTLKLFKTLYASCINFGNVNLKDIDITLDLSYFAGTENVREFRTPYINNVFGSILHLAKNILMTSLYIQGTSASGSIDLFAQNQVSFGRTSSSVVIYAGSNENIECTVPSQDRAWIIKYSSEYSGGYLIESL